MPLAHIHPDHDLDLRRCATIRNALVRDGLFDVADQGAGTARWRIAPTPFLLSQDQFRFFASLGAHLLTFYRALDRLYRDSVRGTQPAWVAEYLDQGKPESLIAYSRTAGFASALPAVIRPDVIPTDAGLVITELDSVPGGIGLTSAMGKTYGQEGFDIVGGPDGMVAGFERMVREQLDGRPGCLAIVVSEEADSYRPEMAWMAARLRARGLNAHCIAPEEICATEDGLFFSGPEGDRPIGLIYRFFELFDLPNVPGVDRIMAAARKGQVAVTPPFKPALEEKLAFALFHHPILAPFWQDALGSETFVVLSGLLPRTWILDPRPLPPVAVIPDLRIGGRALADWRDLAQASQKQRRLVIKPSGFSPLAWGSRGVAVGHDLPQAEWAAVIDRALASFPTTPHILQEFHKGRQFDLAYHRDGTEEIAPMAGRARLSPYYFVIGGQAELAGVLATVCSPEKKLIHGMRDAIMAPCALTR